VQPAALGVVERDAVARPAGEQPKRLAQGLAPQVLQRGVDRREHEAGDGADDGAVRPPEQLLPQALDPVRVLAHERGAKVGGQQLEHGVASGADGVGVPTAREPGVDRHVNQDGLLLDERLDHVDPLPLDLQIAQKGVNSRNHHGFIPDPLSVFWNMENRTLTAYWPWLYNSHMIWSVVVPLTNLRT